MLLSVCTAEDGQRSFVRVGAFAANAVVGRIEDSYNNQFEKL